METCIGLPAIFNRQIFCKGATLSALVGREVVTMQFLMFVVRESGCKRYIKPIK